MIAPQLSLEILADRLAVCRLTSIPPDVFLQSSGEFQAIIRSPGELTLVCAEGVAPAGQAVERGWRALQVVGPLSFSMTGVLAAIAQPLAQAGISIFAVSTFDTDYILVKETKLDEAVAALSAAGHQVQMGSGSG